jgi:putative transposase
MKSILHPWQMLLLILAGWINQQQKNAIEYLIAENRILREKIGKKRILLTDDQRRRLAVKGKILGRKMLAEICSIVTPETILRWHRSLIAEKWDYSMRRNKIGRPSTEKEVVELLVQMAKENPSWGYNRIQGALANLGYKISDTAIGDILREHGIEPAPERKKQTTLEDLFGCALGCVGGH